MAVEFPAKGYSSQADVHYYYQFVRLADCAHRTDMLSTCGKTHTVYQSWWVRVPYNAIAGAKSALQQRHHCMSRQDAGWILSKLLHSPKHNGMVLVEPSSYRYRTNQTRSRGRRLSRAKGQCSWSDFDLIESRMNRFTHSTQGSSRERRGMFGKTTWRDLPAWVVCFGRPNRKVERASVRTRRPIRKVIVRGWRQSFLDTFISNENLSCTDCFTPPTASQKRDQRATVSIVPDPIESGEDVELQRPCLRVHDP